MWANWARRMIVCVLVAAPAWADDTDALIEEVEKRYTGGVLPQPLRPPLTTEQADAFVAAVRFFRESAARDLPRLEAIDPGDSRRTKSDKQRLIHWVKNEVPRLLNESLQQTRYQLSGLVDNRRSFIQFAADIDMNDQDKVRNNLARPEMIEEREAAIREALSSAELLQRIDEQLGEKSEWPARRKEIEDLAARFREKVLAAAALIKPPQDIGDEKLRKIAEEALKDPKYGAGKWKRLIVNSAPQHKEFVTYEVSGNTITRTEYQYDQFQATTIEPEGDNLFLFYNNLAFYTSGATTTPLKKWVVRERFRGPRILAENVDK